MSSVQERLQLKRVPMDAWNIREQLCLASAVVRSGDQNWMSVSRSLKTVSEPNRPPDWYSQKSCAAQYGVLLEHVETPKRKKRSSEGAVETPQESILKRLTQERIVEIQKTLAEMNQQFDQIKTEVVEVNDPTTSEDRLRELWKNMDARARMRERETARCAAWLKEREEKRARADRAWRPTQNQTMTVAANPVSVPTPAPPSSPLLTSLLKSSPVVTTPQHISHPANVVDTMSPSVTAPTLSMLLEKCAPNTQHDSKHAAIEHIKSQLVQIEHQLKANTPIPVPLPPPAPLELDDIEIKAEDVYAFHDIELHMPPTLHKTDRLIEKPMPKKEDLDTTPVLPETQSETLEDQVAKEEPEPMEIEPAIQDVVVIPAEIETPQPLEVPTEVVQEEKESTEKEIKIAFPEVKFPTTEIKVIQPEIEKVKDEIKELDIPIATEIPVEPQKPEITTQEPEITETVPEVPELIEQLPEPHRTEPVEPQKDQEPPLPVEEPALPQPVEIEPSTVEIDPATIPLPSDVEPQKVIMDENITAIEEPTTETEHFSLPEETTQVEEVIQQEKQEVTIEQKLEMMETGILEVKTEELQKIEEELKKDEDAEDSIPLKDIIVKEEILVEPKAEAEVNAERPNTDVEDGHTETDDDTPMELSREEEKDGKKKRDYSRKKKSESRTWSGSESAPDSPAPPDERQHRLWKKSVMLVYSRLCAHKYASLFLRPISDEEAPGYSLVVKRPMDLSTIRKNIDSGVTRTTAQFQRDVLLMLSNALMYNSSSHSVYCMAREMQEEAQGQLGMLVAAQAHAARVDAAPLAHSPGPAHTPALATRKRRRHHSPLPLTPDKNN